MNGGLLERPSYGAQLEPAKFVDHRGRAVKHSQTTSPAGIVHNARSSRLGDDDREDGHLVGRNGAYVRRGASFAVHVRDRGPGARQFGPGKCGPVTRPSETVATVVSRLPEPPEIAAERQIMRRRTAPTQAHPLGQRRGAERECSYRSTTDSNRIGRSAISTRPAASDIVSPDGIKALSPDVVPKTHSSRRAHRHHHQSRAGCGA